jgi:hypothetical protein
MSERNYAKPGQPSDPQERSGTGHDGLPQPAEAKAATSTTVSVSTTDDPDDSDPLAGVPLPKSDKGGRTTDADERLLKPVLTQKNNRTGGG